MMFRKLSDGEKQEFRKWARENDTAAHREMGDIYHPVVRLEWARIDGVTTRIRRPTPTDETPLCVDCVERSEASDDS